MRITMASVTMAVLQSLAATACSGDSNRSDGVGGGGAVAAGQNGGGLGGAGGIDNPDPNTRLDASVGNGGLGGGDPACAGETQGAEPIEVDMYVMLDRSGSMLGLTNDGTTKWDAVRTALIAFAGDPASAGLGVGLQYFPLGKPDVPLTCLNDAECDAAEGGLCLNTACAPSLLGDFEFTFCITSADCPATSPGCVPYGICELDETFACFDVENPDGCADVSGGACQAALGECSAFASCQIEDYTTPAVSIAQLPGNQTAFVDSLMAAQTTGLTPTRPALDGAIRRATAHATENPMRRAIVVLATDGLPTDCVPDGVTTVEQAVENVADIAAAGLAGTPSVRTYVIGVFAPEETVALDNLDTMARAGGSDGALIVDASGDVASLFVAALNEIRAGTLQCELQVPAAPTGQTLSYDRVNIELTANGVTRNLLYVENEDRCGTTELGWYYDVDPLSGEKPTTIRICSDSCAELQALGSQAKLEIRLGCDTLRPQ
jgi:hypothetical protein